MTCVMSDPHGCREKYARMLEKIGFRDVDTLYPRRRDRPVHPEQYF